MKKGLLSKYGLQTISTGVEISVVCRFSDGALVLVQETLNKTLSRLKNILRLKPDITDCLIDHRNNDRSTLCVKLTPVKVLVSFNHDHNPSLTLT